MDMTKKDMEPIVKNYYLALEEGKILGRKCTDCGHIEFPPYLCCNECGCLDTEWVELNDMRGYITQVLPTVGAFGDPDFRKQHGDYWAIGIRIDGMDHFCSSLIHIDPERYDEFDKRIDQEQVWVKPVIIQDEDVKVVVWELEDDADPFKKIPDPATLMPVGASTESTEPAEESKAAAAVDIDPSTDPIAQSVLECAADAYGVDISTLTMATDIREDLSNESMKMIVMISEIEDELDVTIEIQEASLLNTLADFVLKVKEKM